MRCGSEGRLPDRNGKCWMSELRFSWVDTNGRACGIFCLRRSSVVKIQTCWHLPLPRFFDGRRDAGLIRRSFRLQIFIGLCVGRAGAIESNGEEGAALPRRWREKLTDEELNGLGERACPRAPSGALGRRRVRLAPDISKIPPACGRIFFNSARGGACWCTRGRARSPRPWRCRAFGEAGMSGLAGGGAASLVEFVFTRRLVLQVACSRSIYGRLCSMSCSATGGWLRLAGFDEFARGEE
jgi:hypothetical protein